MRLHFYIYRDNKLIITTKNVQNLTKRVHIFVDLGNELK